MVILSFDDSIVRSFASWGKICLDREWRPRIRAMEILVLDGQPLTLAEIEAVALDGCAVAIAPAALARVAASR